MRFEFIPASPLSEKVPFQDVFRKSLLSLPGTFRDSVFLKYLICFLDFSPGSPPASSDATNSRTRSAHLWKHHARPTFKIRVLGPLPPEHDF